MKSHFHGGAGTAVRMMVAVLLVGAIGLCGGMFFVRSLNVGSVEDFRFSSIPIYIIHPNPLNEIHEAYQEKDWTTFSELVDVENVVTTHYDRATNVTARDNAKTREEMDLFLGLVKIAKPMYVQEEKETIRSEVVNHNTKLDKDKPDIFIRLLRESPEQVENISKKSGKEWVVAATYRTKKGKSEKIDFHFQQIDYHLKLVDITGLVALDQ